MRVLLTTDTVGGVWGYTSTLAHSLDAAGHEVLLAVLGDGLDRCNELPERVEIVTRPYRLEWMPGAEDDIRESTAWIEELERRWGADVVHLNQFSPALGNFAAPTVVVAHSDVLSWFSETLNAPAPDEWLAYHRRTGLALRRADVVVAPSRYQSRLLARHYGRAADRVIHNGCIPPAEDPLRHRAPIAVTAGRAWDSAKGVRTLDVAAGRLGSDGWSVHLLGPRTSPHGEELQVKNLVTHGRMDRTGVDAWFSQASVYVGPSLYEPFGLAPLEAALRGCALVLSEIDSFRELWHGCAEFFPPGDAQRLAEVLGSLHQDRGRVSELAEAGRRRALRLYTAADMCREYLSLYEELGSGHARDLFPRPVEQPA